MAAASADNIWVQLAAPIVTLSTALLTLAVNAFRDFSSVSRQSALFELEKRRLEYWKLHQELSADSSLPEATRDDLRISAQRLGRLADDEKHRLRRVLGESIVVVGFLGSLTGFAYKAADLWPGLSLEWKAGLGILATSCGFLTLSYAVDLARDATEGFRKRDAAARSQKPSAGAPSE